jgi:hypothetical protein
MWRKIETILLSILKEKYGCHIRVINGSPHITECYEPVDLQLLSKELEQRLQEN